MSGKSLVTYYQDNNDRLQKRAYEGYWSFSREKNKKNDNIVLKDTKIP